MYKNSAFILALVAVNNIITLTPTLSNTIYYGLFGLIFMGGLMLGRPTVSGSLTLLVIGCIFSLIVNTNLPDFFRAEERLLSFVIMLLLLSPWFYQRHLAAIRSYLFRYTNIFLIIVVVGSFLGNITGSFSGLGRADLYQGLTSHSMLMGPIAALVLLLFLQKLYQLNLSRKSKLMYSGVILICLYSILLAGSRAALIGSALSIIAFMGLKYLNRFTKLIRVALILSGILVVTSPYWSGLAANIDKKNKYAEEQNDTFASRTELWNFRYQEFKASPIFGIGFATSKYGAIDRASGHIEPGSSWGALLAQIGLLGTLPLALLFIVYFKKLYERRNDKDGLSKVLFAILVFFIVHMAVEGYVLASGSFMFFYLWMLLGVIKNKLEGQTVTL